MAINGNNQIRFADGARLTRCSESTYLGHHITQSMNVRQEVGYRMQQTMAARTKLKLKPFWKASNCTDRWKLRVYQAIIQNKFIYGLETIHLTQGMLSKINAFQLRGLRSILRLEPTFVNRPNTNQFVLRTASEKAGLEVKLFSELLLNKRVALAGHILRASDTDPLREVTYCSQSADAYPIGKRRVGGPRQQWRHFIHKHAWTKFVGRTNRLRKHRKPKQANTPNGFRTTFLKLSQCRPTDALAPMAAKKKGMAGLENLLRTRPCCLDPGLGRPFQESLLNMSEEEE